jgi:hypothetical protein
MVLSRHSICGHIARSPRSKIFLTLLVVAGCGVIIPFVASTDHKHVTFTPILPVAVSNNTLSFSITTSRITLWNEKTCMIEADFGNRHYKTNSALWNSDFHSMTPVAGATQRIVFANGLGTAYPPNVVRKVTIGIPIQAVRFRVRENYTQSSWFESKYVWLDIPFIHRLLWRVHWSTKIPEGQDIFSPWIYRTNGMWIADQ